MIINFLNDCLFYVAWCIADRNQHQKRYNDEDVLKYKFVDSLCSFKIPKLCRNKRNKEEGELMINKKS